MRLMRAMLAPLASSSPSLVAPLAMALCVGCGGGGGSNKPPENVGQSTTTGETQPKVVVEDATETWFDDTPASPTSKVREYDRDVTKATTVKGTDTPPVIKKLRVRVVFPVPKVEPKDERDPHVVNRLLWDVRQQIAACFYKGAGKEPTDEMSMVGWIDLTPKGEVKDAGVESQDEGLKKGSVGDCIVENVKGLAFAPTKDATKIRFKLKMQTLDGSTLSDFEATPVTKDKDKE